MSGLTWDGAVYIARIAAFLPLILYVSWTDMRRHIIPDRALLLGAAAAIAIAAADSVISHTFKPLLQLLLGALAGGLPLFLAILISRGKMGAGDMKLLAVMGAMFGVLQVLLCMFFGILFAGLFSVVALAVKKANRQTMIPLAPFFAAGWLFITVFRTPLSTLLWLYYGISL